MRAYDRRAIVDAINEQLSSSPLVETRNRKALRENPLAQWELRVGSFRALYNVVEEEERVDVVAVGEKVGSVLRIEGKEYRL